MNALKTVEPGMPHNPVPKGVADKLCRYLLAKRGWGIKVARKAEVWNLCLQPLR